MPGRSAADPPRDVLLRAARCARLPGVTRAEICERYGLSPRALRRAQKDLALEAIPSRHDWLLHALSDAGRRRDGELGSLEALASWLDYVNKDGSTAAEVRGLLEDLERAGRISLEGDRWALTGEFP